MRRFWIGLGLLLAGCAELPPAAPPGKALVHFYRRAIPLGPANLVLVDDRRTLGSLPDGTYLDYVADPGPRVFKAMAPGTSSIPYATTLVAGQVYYLMVYFLGDQARGNAAVTPMDAATAAKHMASLKPAPP